MRKFVSTMFVAGLAAASIGGTETGSGIEGLRLQSHQTLHGEQREDWVSLATKLHGAFGSYVALGVYIGLDALERLNADPRSVDVSVATGPGAPCPCVADGLQLATGATPGRGNLTMEASPAGADVFNVVTVKAKSGRTLRYTIPLSLRSKLDEWNKLPAAARLAALKSAKADEIYKLEDLK